MLPTLHVPLRRVVAFAAAAAIALGGSTLACLLALPDDPDPIVEWSAVGGVVTRSIGRGLQQQRALTLMHLAMHDACNAVRPLYASFAEPFRAPAGATADIAVAAAAHDVLAAELPRPSPTLEMAYARALLRAPAAARDAGIATGREAARRVLARRRDDGARHADVPFTPRAASGTWVPTPPDHRPALLPGWSRVRPFLLATAGSVRPPAPPALTSAQYAREYDEVRRLGGATAPARSARQADVARLWSGDVAERWNAIARGAFVGGSPGDPSALWRRARAFAALNMAMADGFIAGWDAKYHYRVWRPVTAIAEATRDGNPATAPEPGWMPLLPTPAHPEYPSTHSVLSGAAAQLMACATGSDAATIAVDGGERVPGMRRRYARYSDVAREVAESRIHAGAHFRSANDAGLRQGGRIGALACLALPPLAAATRSRGRAASRRK